jgi:energy-coupling factor transporter ATP-binding protein EcfA2
MIPKSSSGPFNSFNARALNSTQVAETFVPSVQYRALCRRCHTIVLGPRGSGKTTLLKMLQTAALEMWPHHEAKSYADSIDFTGVFIATDVSWGEQLKSLGHGKLDDSTHKLFSVATFTTHVLHALVSSMEYRARGDWRSTQRSVRRVELSTADEASFAVFVAKAWHLEGILPTLSGLRLGLTGRLLAIREIASKEAFFNEQGRPERLEKHRFLHLHFLRASVLAIELFDQLINESGARWALLCDEIELAPKWIQSELLQALRSTDDRFLFKLALNPFTDNSAFLSEASSAAAGQDFEQLALWYAEKRDALQFCTSLWDEMFASRGTKSLLPAKVFGNSQFGALPKEEKPKSSAYGPESRWARKFVSLQEKDATFRSYLKNRKIDPRNMHLFNENEQAAEVRKIAPIVAIRDFYRQRDDQGRTQLRSRKAPLLYSGAESVFAITEGNPRWFLGLMASMVDLAGRLQPEFPSQPIPAAIQARELLKISQRFAATLKTIPTHESAPSGMGVLQLVRKIALYMYQQAVVQPFRPEPPGSFIVDSNAPEHLLITLGQALNAGAIVYVPDDDGQLILTSLRGKRFRPSYLLAPLYRFPIRLGASVSLASIMRWDGAEEHYETSQLELITDGENDAEES